MDACLSSTSPLRLDAYHIEERLGSEVNDLLTIDGELVAQIGQKS
jgi:hypothetical protein